MKRHANTATEMKNSGEWNKVGPKHYRHIDGADVKYDHAAWGWRINNSVHVWPVLHIAKYNVETGRYLD